MSTSYTSLLVCTLLIQAFGILLVDRYRGLTKSIEFTVVWDLSGTIRLLPVTVNTFLRHTDDLIIGVTGQSVLLFGIGRSKFPRNMYRLFPDGTPSRLATTYRQVALASNYNSMSTP
ncbi:hypothetical protein C8J57DRAFT_1467166 [Mycena rebaudengoi]|nr:hypothetical protein C8J57DRAFT_1467166 [Mycena rebaudengoi]